MSKVYVLYHIHKFKKELSECLYGHVDKKLIGISYSKERCYSSLEIYKKLPGFNEDVKGFQIDEYVVDSIYNSELNELINQYSSKKDPLKLLYLLYFAKKFWLDFIQLIDANIINISEINFYEVQ